MSDLISRSELINKIRGIVPSSQDVDFIVRLIDALPTAYDKDNVVEELEEFMDEAKQFNASGMVTDMIEVVRKGGVE